MSNLVRKAAALGVGLALTAAACGSDQPNTWNQTPTVPDKTVEVLSTETTEQELIDAGVDGQHITYGRVAVQGQWQPFMIYASDDPYPDGTPNVYRNVAIGNVPYDVKAGKLPCKVTLEDGKVHIYTTKSDDKYRSAGKESYDTMLAGTEPLIAAVRASGTADDISFREDRFEVENDVSGGLLKDYEDSWVTDLYDDVVLMQNAAAAACAGDLG